LRGGQIAKTPPKSVLEIWDKSGLNLNPVEASLKWLLNRKEVGIILSGMTSIEQVEENIRIVSGTNANCFTETQLETFSKVRKAFRDLSPISCTKCRYCLPCPQGIPIPDIFDTYNQAKIYDDLRRMKILYTWIPEDKRAHVCKECRICEEKCPQKLPIVSLLKKANTLLT